MAKKNKIEIDVHADDDGTLKKVGVESKKAAKGMDDLSNKSNNARRNMGGAADMSNRGVKSFSKMQQGVGGLVGVYATLAAQVFAVSAAFQFLKSASDVVNLIAGQEALGAVSGVAYKTITASIKEATGGQIAYAEAAKAAAIGTAAGLSPEQLDRLGVAAKNVSNALGRDLTDSFNRLVRGITKAEPELLDELGIILRLDDATQKYADTLGLAKDDLTTFQKSQAVAIETLTQAEEKFGAINEIMDPSAASLNKFLVSFDDLMNSIKTGAMKGLRPVFDFLAGNTRALTAALTLMALPIIKSLIPSFENWGKKVNKSLEAQREGLKDYRGEIDKTKDAIAMMGRDSASIGKSSAGVLGSLGKDTTSASKGSGAAFLLGTSDTKAAQNNARKILDNAKAQMKEHNAVLTGYLQGATAQQLAILETNYSQRRILLKKHEAAHGNSWKKLGLHVKHYVQEAKLALMSLGTSMVSFVGNIGTHLAKLFSIGMWLSLGAMVGELLLGWLDKLYPIGEEAEKLQLRIEKLEKSNKTLNEELKKMAQYKSFLTLGEQVKQIGQAFTSTNIIGKLRELRTLQETPPPAQKESTKLLNDIKSFLNQPVPGTQWMGQAFNNAVNTIPLIGRLNKVGLEAAETHRKAMQDPHWQKASDGTLEVLKNLAQLNPEVQAYVELFEEQGHLTAKQAVELDKVQQKWQTYGMGVDKAKESIKEFNDELRALIGEGLQFDPTAQLRMVGAKSIKVQSEGLQGMAEEQGNIAQARINRKAELRSQYQQRRDLLAQNKQFVDTSSGTIAFTSTDDPDAARQAQEEWNKITLEIKNSKFAVDEYGKTIVDNNKALEAAIKQLARTMRIQKAMNKLSEKIRPMMEKRNSLELKAAQAKTLGITVEQKLANFQAAELGRQAKSLKLQENLLVAQTAQKAAREEYGRDETEINEQAKIAAENAVKLAEHKISLDTEEVRLAREKAHLDQMRLGFMLAQAAIRQDTTGMLEAQILEDSRRRREESMLGGGGRNKVQLGLEKRQRTIESIEGANGKIHQAINDQFAAETKQREAYKTGTAAQQAAADRGLVTAKAKLQVLRDQVHALKNYNQIQVNALQNEQADAQKALGELSLDPRKQAQKQALGRLDENATDQQKKDAMAAAGATFDLNLQLEETSALYETIQSSMSGAFEDMITGAKSAKEAFASMAKSMLAELAKIIAKRLMLKALGALGFAEGGITPKLKGRSYTVGGVARGPSSGYQATLHGNEAVVPLPSGGAIPVQGTGLGGGTNNVTVNVNVDNNGNASSESQGQGMGQDLGKVVAKAVQEELQYQKRSGGILNPYGAA